MFQLNSNDIFVSIAHEYSLKFLMSIRSPQQMVNATVISFDEW
jgi:hypothetical protein